MRVKILMLYLFIVFLTGCGSDRISNSLSIDLTKENNTEVIFYHFGGPENIGRWTDGNPATLKFNKILPKDFEIKINYSTTFLSNLGKDFIIRVGHQERFFQGNEKPTTLSINFNNVEKDVDSIFIISPLPKSPSELKLSDDTRKLGIAIRSIELIPKN
jgi:hypothetical protein